MTDPLKLHKEVKGELDALYQRMKDDSDLVNKVNYVMQDKNKKDIKNVISMQGNRPQVFAAYVEAALSRADEKIIVESDDEKLDTAYIEDAARDIFAAANQKRRASGDWNIEPIIDQYNCRRGRCNLRVICQILKNKEGKPYLDIDMTPWDPLYTVNIPGANGHAQSGYELKKTKAQIESESWAQSVSLYIGGKGATEIDIWTPEVEHIYIDNKKIFEQANPWGFVPVCSQTVPIGSMLADEDNAAYEGESIFFLIRHLIPEFNRLVSILQTKNFESVKTPIQVKTDGQLEEGFYDKATSPGSATPVKDINAIHPIHFEDIKQSAITLLNQINQSIDDGTLSRIMLGTLPTGGLSAVALLQVEQGQGQVYMPRLGTRGLLKQRALEMAVEQITATKQRTVEIGTTGHKKVYDVVKLQGEYAIEINYSNKDPNTDYARLSLGKGYIGILDELTILKDIVKREDPEGDLAKLRRQQLRELVPNLRIYDGLMSLAELYEKGDESVADEIEIVEQALGITLDQLKSGQLPQLNQPEQPNQEGLPVFAGEKSSSQKAADLKREMPEEVGSE